MFFPVCNEKIPCSDCREFVQKVSCFNWFVQAGRGVSREIPCIFPPIREFQDWETVRCSLPAQPPSRGFSGLSRDTRQSVRKKPGIARPIGRLSLGLEDRESVSAEESRVFSGLSLLGIFGGHTCRRSRWSPPSASIMMCVELRIRCSQPPSRGFSALSGHSPNSPEEARNCATNWRSFSLT